MVEFDELGREVPDPVPMEIPAGFRRPESTTEAIQRIIRTTLSRHAADVGMETFEEAEDFDMEEDDIEPMSPHEYRAMAAEIPAEDRELFEKWRAERAKREQRAAKKAAQEEAAGREEEEGADSGVAGESA